MIGPSKRCSLEVRDAMTLHPLIVGTLARDRIDRLMEVGAAERRGPPRAEGVKEAHMESIGSVIAVAAVVALWVAAVWFGRDSREGRDWSARTNMPERSRGIED
jgi:hypothetical protein